MMLDAVSAATETEPMARCSTAAMNQASRMLSSTGPPASAENSLPSASPMPAAVMTLPSEPPTPVISRISPLVRKPSESAVLVRSTPIRRRASRNAQSRPTNSARLALPMNSMKSLETPARSGERPEGDHQQRDDDRRDRDRQARNLVVVLGVDLGIVGLDLQHRLVRVLVGLGLPVAGPQQRLEEEGGDERGGEPDQEAPEQPGAEADVDLPRDQDHGQAGHDEDVAGEDAGADGAREQREAVGTEVGRGRPGHRRGQHDLHVDVDGGEDRRHRPGHGVGQPLGADRRHQRGNHALERTGGMEQRSDHDPEPDQEPDLGHDLAEAERDRLQRAGESDPARQAEIERAQDQRDDRIHPQPDDQPDHQDDRDGGVQDDHWHPPSAQDALTIDRRDAAPSLAMSAGPGDLQSPSFSRSTTRGS